MRRVRAFDAYLIHRGNRGLDIDHAEVSTATDALLVRMTETQIRSELRGWRPQPIDGLYYAGGDESLGLPPYRMVDGPRGARVAVATAFPVAIARGATFDVELERRVGLAIGLEVAAKGGNVLLAPTINLLRHPGWGRAQETYSEDTHHMGAMAVAFVSGAQNHVLTSPQHFALNNLENMRFELSADVDARTLHEVHLPHFRRCVVEAAAASIMSAYNKVNGVYCGEHAALLTQILRRECGFTGFVESDWFLGTRSTAAALEAGLDIEMPAAYRFTDEKIDAALADGTLDAPTLRRSAPRGVSEDRLAARPSPATAVRGRGVARARRARARGRREVDRAAEERARDASPAGRARAADRARRRPRGRGEPRRPRQQLRAVVSGDDAAFGARAAPAPRAARLLPYRRRPRRTRGLRRDHRRRRSHLPR